MGFNAYNYRMSILLWIIKTYTCSLDLVTSDIVFVDLFWTLNLFWNLNNQDKIHITEENFIRVWFFTDHTGSSLIEFMAQSRITIPSCVEQSIRKKYPEEDGVYEGAHFDLQTGLLALIVKEKKKKGTFMRKGSSLSRRAFIYPA